MGASFFDCYKDILSKTKSSCVSKGLPSKFSDGLQHQVHSLESEIQEKQGTIHTVFHQHPLRPCTPTSIPINSSAKSFHPYGHRKPTQSARPLGSPQEEADDQAQNSLLIFICLPQDNLSYSLL